MFLDFLLHLRAGGMKVSLNEWLSLVEGMRMGLHGQTVRGFYILTRSLLVKSETDLDKFEELFYQFFKDVGSEELRKQMEELLHDPETAAEIFGEYMEKRDMSPETLRNALDARMEAAWGGVPVEQGEPARMEGRPMAGDADRPAPGTGSMLLGSGGKSVIHARGDRRFRDWRTDCTIESRQFQMAFRLLRELSRKLDTHEEELDIMGTIRDTAGQGGILKIRMQPPRRNRLKLMVLIDSGGSMRPFEQLCSLLFQSLHKANTFSDLKIYYFHNCLEGELYEDPSIDTDKTVKTDWVLRNIPGSYRVIFVGDAEMAMHELKGGYGNYVDGLTWFKRFKDQYEHSIWLHPQEREEYAAWMSESFLEIEKVFPMYRLSIDGLKEGMYKLMENH